MCRHTGVFLETLRQKEPDTLNKELPHKLCCQLSAGEITGGRPTLQAVHAAPLETHAQQKDIDYRCI